MSLRPILCPIDDPQKNPKFFEFFQYPIWVSPKIDGIRGLTPRMFGVQSRTDIKLPSQQVQERFGRYQGLDGELTAGAPHNTVGIYNMTQSHVMSDDKPASILEYHVFDCILEDVIQKMYYERYEALKKLVRTFGNPDIKVVEQTEVESLEELLAYEQVQLANGYEGIIARSPVGVYKNGRCTMREANMFKVKRFKDLEGVIVGFYEAMTNTNEKQESELGYTKRSTAKEGMVPAGTLGGFLVDFQDGSPVERVGCGAFTHPERQHIWNNRELFLGKLLKVRRFDHGAKERSRQARAIGFRSRMDL
jgi:hypothetical protein